jgi:hypothetical protein
MNSSKSGARSNELPPQELDGSHALLGRTGDPVRESVIVPSLFGERRHAHDTLQSEGHRLRTVREAGNSLYCISAR